MCGRKKYIHGNYLTLFMILSAAQTLKEKVPIVDHKFILKTIISRRSRTEVNLITSRVEKTANVWKFPSHVTGAILIILIFCLFWTICIKFHLGGVRAIDSLKHPLTLSQPIFKLNTQINAIILIYLRRPRRWSGDDGTSISTGVWAGEVICS